MANDNKFFSYFDDKELEALKSIIFPEENLISLNDLENESKQSHKQMVTSMIKGIYGKNNSQIYSDLKIMINDRVFNTHKIILMCFAPFIFVKISQVLQNYKVKSLNKVNKIRILDIDHNAFDIILRYMYCGELQTPNENNFDLVRESSLRLKMLDFSKKWTHLYGLSTLNV